MREKWLKKFVKFLNPDADEIRGAYMSNDWTSTSRSQFFGRLCDIHIIADIADNFFSSAENQKFFKNIFRKDFAKMFKKSFLKK